MSPVKIRQIVVWHGECTTLYYVVEFPFDAPDTWEVIGTCHTRGEAEALLKSSDARRVKDTYQHHGGIGGIDPRDPFEGGGL